jgi:hypothetical protein
MAKKPTAEDARLILQLYDLRREAEMRKARHWWLINFWPENAEAYLKIDMAFGSQENNWLRQLMGYWGMATSMVLHGALSEKLFLEPAFSGEMFFIFAKIHPFLKELREKTQNPDLMGNIEKVIMSTKEGRQRFERISQRVAFRRKTMAKAAS